MRSRPLLILLLIAAALAAWLFFVEKPRDEKARQQWEAETQLMSIQPDDVERFAVYRQADTLEFQIRDTHWEVTHPVIDIADQSAVGRILGSLSEANIFRNLGSGVDRRSCGLDPPEATIVAVDAGGDTLLDLDVGALTVDRSWCYASLSGSADVLLVPTGVRRYLLTAVEDVRNKRVANFDISVVDSFAVTSPLGSLAWKRRGATGWFTVSDGDTVSGDPTDVEALLRRVRAMRAWSFPDPRGAAPYLDSSPYRVDIVRRLPAPPIHITVAWSDSGSGYTHVEGETRVVEIDTAVAVIFRQTLLDLRDRRVLRFDPRRVERVVIQTPDTTGTLVRAGDHWSHPNPRFQPPEDARVAALFRHLATMRYRDVLRPGTTELSGKVTFRVALYGNGATIIDEVVGGASPTPGRMAVTGERLGLLADVDMGDIDQFTTMLRGMSPQTK